MFYMSPILLHLQYERGILVLDGNKNHIKLICVCVFFFPIFPVSYKIIILLSSGQLGDLNF